MKLSLSFTLHAIVFGLAIAGAARASDQYFVSASTYSPVGGTVANGGTPVVITAQLCDATTGIPDRVQGKSITWSKSGGGSLSTTTGTTDFFGIATVTLTTASGAGNTYTVTASDGTSSGTSATITTISSAGPAAKFIITSDLYTLKAGDVASITAQLADANSNPLTTSGVTVTWGGNGSGGFSNITKTNSGIATVTLTTASSKATYRITASGGGASGTSPAITTANSGLTAPNADSKGGLVAPLPFVDYSEVLKILQSTGRCTDCHYGADTSIPDYSTATTVWNTLRGNGNITANYDNSNGGNSTNFDSPAEMRLLLSDASQSFIFFKINNTNPPGGQMPYDGPPFLSTVEMQIIRDWINQGAYDLPSKYHVTVSSSSPVAGAAITVTAQLRDSHGNNLALPGRTVTWSKAGSGGSFATSTSTTDENGTVTVSFTTGTTVASYTLTATDGEALTGTNSTVTSVAGPAAKYGVTAATSTPTVGTGITITAQLQDANGNAVTTSGNTVAWTSTNGGSFSSGGSSTTDASGIATITFTVSTTAGTVHTVKAKTGAVTGTSGNITTQAGAPSKYTVTSSNTTPTVGTAVTITAKLADQYGNLLTSGGGASVNWTQSGISGNFGSASSTVTAGVATVTYTCGTTVGASTVTATDSVTNTINGNVVLTLQVGAAAEYVVTSSSYSPIAGSTVTISAQLADQYGNTVKTQNKTVTWNNNTTGGNFGTATSLTDVNGLATVTFTTSATSGHAHTVTGTDTSSFSGTTPAITTIAGPATKYLVTAATTSPAAGSTTDVITAQLADVNNNSVSTSGITVNWSLSGTGTLSGASSTTNSSGRATITLTASTHATDTCTITASDPGPGTKTGVTATLTVVAATAAKYSVTSSSSTPTVGTNVTISAQLQDTYGNNVSTSGNVVAWSSTNGGSFSVGTTNTNASGVATVTYTVSTVAATVHKVTGATGGLTGQTSNITTQAGTPAKYLVTSSNNSPTVATAVTITAKLADTYGNLLTTGGGASVNWTQSGVGGSFGSASSTVTAGVASVTFTCGNTAGAATVTATDATFAYTGNVGLTLTAAAAAKYVVTSSTYSPTTGSTVTIFAQLADTYGNAVSVQNNVVTWSSTNGGSFGAPTSSTNVNGLAQVTFTVSSVSATAHTVTGTDGGGLTGASAAITTVTGAATKYVVTAGTNSPAAGSTTDVITAQLADVGGNPVTTSGITVNWTLTGTGTLSATSSVTNASGRATVTLTASTHSGDTATLTATDTPGGLTGTSAVLTVIPAAADHYVVTAGASTATAGTNVSVTAQLQDVYNNNINQSGNGVTWSSTNGGSFSAGTTNTNGSGVATVTYTVSTIAGTVHQVTGYTGAVTGTSGTITTQADVPSQYLVTASTAAPQVTGTITLTAKLADQYGNLLTSGGGASVNWGRTGVTGTFGSASSTVSAGVASTTFTLDTTAGSAILSATDATFPSYTGSVTINAQPLAATQYLVTSSSYSPDAGTNVSISAQLADQYGNSVSTANNTVTWSSQSTGGSFSAATSLTNAGGLAQVTFTTSVVSGHAHTISGTDGGGLTGTSATITTVVGPPTQYIVTAVTSTPVAATATDVITAQLADVQGNFAPISNVTVNWTLIGAGSLSASSSLTDATGKVTVTLTASTHAGDTATVDATDTPFGRTGSSPLLTVIPAAPAKYIVTPASTTPTVGTTDVVTAQLTDSYGNSIATPNNTVTWSASGSGGSFSAPATLTNNSGLATVTFTVSTVSATTHAVTAIDQNLLAGTSANIVTQVGAPAKYLLTSTNYAPVVTNVITITTQLADTYGNSVTSGGPVITWSKTSTDGSFASPTSTVLASGQASISFTCGTTAQNVTISAKDNSGPPNLTGAVTIALQPDVASQYLFTASTTSPIAGSSVSIFAQLADLHGNSVPTALQTVTWNDHGTFGTFGSATSQTDVTGKATVSYTTSTASGYVHTIDGVDGNSITGTAVTLTTVPGPAVRYVVTSTSLSPIAGNAVTIDAQLVDLNNNAVTTNGLTVTWSKTTPTGSFSAGTSSVTAGHANVTFTTPTSVAQITVTATDNSVPTAITGNVTLNSIPGAPAKYLVSSSNSTPVAGTPVTVSAQLTDINGNAVSTGGRVVNWSKSGAGGALAFNSTLTNVSGIAAVQFTVNTVAGTIHTVSALDGNGLSGSSGAITAVPGVGVKYLVTSNSYSPIAGTSIFITAQLQDVNSNNVPAAGKIVSWSADATGTFASPTSTTNASGVATISFATTAQANIVFNVTGADAQTHTGSTPPITTMQGVPSAYLVTPSSNRPVAGAPVTITAQLVDAGGNFVSVSGITVNWTNSGLGTFSASSSTTGSSGAAVISFTPAPTIGIFTLTATDTNGLTGTSFALGSVAGAPTSYIVTASSTSITAGNAVRVTAQLVDVNGNLASTAGRVVSWSSSAGGTFSAATSTTDSNGQAGIQFTSDLQPNIYTITARDTQGITGSGPQITAAAPATGVVTVPAGIPILTSAISATGAVSTPFSFAVTASGDGPITFTAAPLPPGLILSGDTITGLPETSGTFTVQLTATNAVGSDSEDITITIAPQQDLSVDKAQLRLNFAPNATAGDSLSVACSVTLPEAIQLSTSSLDMYFGGLKFSGLTMLKTRAAQGGAILTVRPAARGSSTLKFSLVVTKSDLKALARNGFVNGDLSAKVLSVPVDVIITTANHTYACGTDVPLTYNCKKDKTGIARKLP